MKRVLKKIIAFCCFILLGVFIVSCNQINPPSSEPSTSESENSSQSSSEKNSSLSEEVSSSDISSSEEISSSEDSNVSSEIESSNPSSDISSSEHKCEFSEEVIIINPTCEDKGTKTYTCECGESYSEDIEPLGHSYGEWEVVTKPTILEQGKIQKVCEHNSKHTIDATLPILNDNEYFKEVINPTCEKEGQATYTYKENLEFVFTVTLSKLDHDYQEELSYDSSCHYYKCENCGAISGKEEHTFENEVCISCGYAFDQLIYELNETEDGYILVSHNGNPTSLVIPRVYNGLPVVEIGENSLRCAELEELTIPNSIKKINNFAIVSDCMKIINFDGTLEEWCEIEFNGMYSNPNMVSAYIYFFKIENMVSLYEVQDHHDFYLKENGNYVSLDDLVVPSTVEKIGYSQFAGIKSLKSVTLPEGLISIGSGAFGICSSLTSIELPSTLIGIGDSAFYYCNKLENVYYKGTIKDWCKIEFGDPGSNPMYYASHFYMIDENDEWYEVTEIEIPSTITSIGNSQFYGFDNVTSIVIPEGPKSIGKYAFYNCSNLTSIELPSTLESIGDGAFDSCNKLENVYYKGTIKDWCKIEFGNYYSNPMYYASHFYMIDENNEWYEVTEIEIPSTITSIGNSQFYGFDNVTSIVIPEGPKSIGKYAFYNCSNLTSIELPSTLESIGYAAFYNCSSLTSITLPFVGEKADGSGDTQFGYIFGADAEGTNDYYVPGSLKEVIITGGISIGQHAFYNCSNLTSIELPSTLTSIGDGAFGICSSLTSIELPSTLTSIGDRAFQGCSNLTSIELPSTLTSIGDRAFHVCINLTSIEIPSTLTSIGFKAFYGCSSLTSIELPSTLTSIGDSAFCNCSSLTSITIPDSVTSIGSEAFENCSSLTSITLPFVGEKGDGSGETHFGYIFGASSYGHNDDYVPGSLKEVIITGGISIGSYAFIGCSGLTSVELPSTLTSIGDSAFYGCSSLTSIELPSTLTSIGSEAFENCYRLAEVYNLSSSLTITAGSSYNGHVGYYAKVIHTSLNDESIITEDENGYVFYFYEDKYHLIQYKGEETELVLPEKINGNTYEIGDYAFFGCSGLTSVTLPKELISIGYDAFNSCNKLENVYYKGTIADWCNISFCDYSSNPMSYASHFYMLDENEEWYEVIEIEIPSTITSIGDYQFYGFDNLEVVYNASDLVIEKEGSDNGYVGYYATNVYNKGEWEYVDGVPTPLV